MLFPYRDENQAASIPIFTIAMIAINTLVYFNTAVSGDLAGIVERFGFTADGVLSKPQVVFTSIFLHANFIHLISNMWFLWLFGDNVEAKLGPISFLALYLVSGVVGSFTHTFFTGMNLEMPVIGASGAVAGVMGAYLLFWPQARVRCVFFLVFYPLFFRIRAFWFLGVWMVFEFMGAVAASPRDIVAHWAHVGGFGCGFLWALLRRGE